MRPKGGSVASLLEGRYGARFTFSGGKTTQLDLPLCQPETDGEPLACNLIGYLVYLPKDTRVIVYESSMNDQTPTVSNAKTSVQWKLVLQRRGEEGEKRRKPLMCAVCGRAFPSVKAISCHISTMHDTKASNSIWKKPLRVIYQDEWLAVVDKPQGMPVIGDRKTLFRSGLLMALAGSGPNSLKKPNPVHRLDAGTGGLLVVAKTKLAEVKLRKCFEECSCRKQYRAIVFGKLEAPEDNEEKALLCNSPIGGKPAETFYRVVKHTRSADPMSPDGWITTVDLFPTDGRRHQLRRHLKEAGHPIWGDRRYARYPKRDGRSVEEGGEDEDERRADMVHQATVNTDPHIRLCLWATEITFPHPETQVDTTFRLPAEPEWLSSLVVHEESKWMESQRENSDQENNGAGID